MSKIKILFLCVAGLLIVAFFLKQNPPTIVPKEKVSDFTLLDHHGKSHQLSYYSDVKGVVLYSYGIGCPIARHASVAIEKLKEDYEKKGVKFFMIDAYKADTRDDLLKEAKDFGITIPILMDKAQIVSAGLKVKRTGEAILIDLKNLGIVYRGSIDDRLGYETQRREAKNKYLEDGIRALLKRKRSKIERTEVKGCLISYESFENLTYIKDVMPIFEQRCVRCHYDGGSAPWRMNGYETITKWNAMIKEVVMTKRMPPFDGDPYYEKELINNLELSSDETKKLIQWIDQGMLRGEGEDRLPAVEKKLSKTIWPWGNPDLILTVEKDVPIPETGLLEIPIKNWTTPLPEDMWVKAIYIYHPNNQVVEETSLWSVDISTDHQTETSSGNPGFEGREMLQVSARGLPQYPYPQGTAKFLQKGKKLYLGTHYISTGKKEVDRIQVGLYFYKDEVPPTPYVHLAIFNNDFTIPAKKRNHYIYARHVFNEDVLVHAGGVHFHYRGTSGKVTAIFPDGRKKILFSIPTFDFDWQALYQFKEPIALPANTEVLVEGWFDNTEQNSKNLDPHRDIKYGTSKVDEMFWGVLHYTRT